MVFRSKISKPDTQGFSLLRVELCGSSATEEAVRAPCWVVSLI